MKTRNLLLLGATAFAAITINATASNALLSPCAAASQIKIVSGISVVQAAPTTRVALSPRTAGNQIATVTGKSNDVNPASLCSRYMTGSSPKAIQACAANPTAAMPCCAVAVVK